MNRKKLMLTMAGLMSLSVALTACGGSSDSGSNDSNSGDKPKDQASTKVEEIKAESPDKIPDVAKNRKDTLIMGIQDPDGVFNPMYGGGSAYDADVYSMIFSSALERNEDGSFCENLCDMPKISNDGKTFAFKLKDGVKWSDGEPITSDDMELYFKVMDDKSYTGVSDLNKGKIKGLDEYKAGTAKDISGIKKIDKQTLEITVEEVTALTLEYVIPTPVPSQYYGKVYTQGDTSKIEALHREPKVSSGPYKFVSYKPGEQVVLEANENYFLGKPKIKNFIFKTITDKTDLAQLQAGEIDAMNKNISPETVEQVKDMGFVNIMYSPFNGYGYVGMNMLGNSKFKDVKVRQAMMYAVDREKDIDSLFGQYAVPINTPIAKVSWAYPKDDSNLNEYKYDLDKAAKLLEEAGWKKNSQGKLEKDGEIFTIKFLQATDNQNNTPLVPILKDSMEKLGIEFVADQFDFNTVKEKVNKGKSDPDSVNFDMWSMSWQLNPEPDPSNLYKTNASQNPLGYSNPKVDELMDKEIKELDKEKRIAIFKDLAEELNKDLPCLYLFQKMDGYQISSRVKGFRHTNNAHYYRYVHEMTLE